MPGMVHLLSPPLNLFVRGVPVITRKKEKQTNKQKKQAFANILGYAPRILAKYYLNGKTLFLKTPHTFAIGHRCNRKSRLLVVLVARLSYT